MQIWGANIFCDIQRVESASVSMTKKFYKTEPPGSKQTNIGDYSLFVWTKGQMDTIGKRMGAIKGRCEWEISMGDGPMSVGTVIGSAPSQGMQMLQRGMAFCRNRKHQNEKNHFWQLVLTILN